MTDEPETLSRRAAARKASKTRREVRAALAQVTFEAVAAGWTVEQIAEMRKVNVRTIRREVDRVLDERRLDAPERYVHFQVSRLTKALRLADAAIDRGELRAVTPMVRLVAALDRYHGLKGEPLALVPPLAPPPALAEPLVAPAPPARAEPRRPAARRAFRRADPRGSRPASRRQRPGGSCGSSLFAGMTRREKGAEGRNCPAAPHFGI